MKDKMKGRKRRSRDELRGNCNSERYDGLDY